MDKTKPVQTARKLRTLKRLTPTFVKYKNIEDYYNNFYHEDDHVDHEIDENFEKIDLNKVVKDSKSLSDLIKIAKTPINHFLPCNRDDLRNLKKLLPELEDLDQMVGMHDIKNLIGDMILYYCQDLHKIQLKSNKPGVKLLHTVIQGPPGCGKTTVAKLIGRIYLKLGLLKSEKFIEAKRKDMIGKYLGQTAPATTKILESALGGVLFVDEAYSLGTSKEKDMYSEECINTINQFLTEHGNEFAMIIAGYKDKLKTHFFRNNNGLRRRFPWVYTIKPYKPEEIQSIFVKQVIDAGWSFDHDIPADFFKKNEKFFKDSGGDTQNFFDKCQFAHSRNTFGLPMSQKGKITADDLSRALESHKHIKKPNTEVSQEELNEFMELAQNDMRTFKMLKEYIDIKKNDGEDLKKFIEVHKKYKKSNQISREELDEFMNLTDEELRTFKMLKNFHEMKKNDQGDFSNFINVHKRFKKDNQVNRKDLDEFMDFSKKEIDQLKLYKMVKEYKDLKKDDGEDFSKFQEVTEEYVKDNDKTHSFYM